MAARVTGAKLVFLDCEMDGSYTKEAIEKVITERTKFAAITHVSNVIGRVNPVEDIIRLVHKNGGVVLVDAAQSAPHLPIDVCAMDVDSASRHRPQADENRDRRPLRKGEASG